MKEKINNLEQANFYLEKLGLEIRVGLDFKEDGKIFYVLFPKTDEYLEHKSIWMERKRDGQ